MRAEGSQHRYATTSPAVTGDADYGPAGVAALACGLAYSVRPDRECVSELLGASRGALETLRRAAGDVQHISSPDPTVCRRASHLLAEALRIATAHPVNQRQLVG